MDPFTAIHFGEFVNMVFRFGFSTSFKSRYFCLQRAVTPLPSKGTHFYKGMGSQPSANTSQLYDCTCIPRFMACYNNNLPKHSSLVSAGVAGQLVHSLNIHWLIFREARLSLVRIHTKENPLALDAADWSLLSDKTEGYSGSDIANMVLGALFEPVRELQCTTTWKHTPGTHETSYYEILINCVYLWRVVRRHDYYECFYLNLSHVWNRRKVDTVLWEWFRIKRNQS